MKKIGGPVKDSERYPAVNISAINLWLEINRDKL